MPYTMSRADRAMFRDILPRMDAQELQHVLTSLRRAAACEYGGNPRARAAIELIEAETARRATKH